MKTAMWKSKNVNKYKNKYRFSLFLFICPYIARPPEGGCTATDGRHQWAEQYKNKDSAGRTRQ